MAQIDTQCPNCQGRFRIAEDWPEARCPHCGTHVQFAGVDRTPTLAQPPASHSAPYQQGGTESSGVWVLVYGILANVFGAIGWLTFAAICCPGVGAVLPLIGIAFGAIAVLTGRSVLQQVREGRAGADARPFAIVGMIAAILALLYCIPMLLWNLFITLIALLGSA